MLKQYFNRFRPYSGILGVVILWLFIITAMRRTGLGLIDPRPISYLGVDPMSAVLFSIGLIISSLLFILFALYVDKRFHTNRRFMAYFMIGQAGQIIAAIAPYGKDSPYKLVHTIAAFILAFSLPFLIREFARTQKHKPWHREFRRLFYFELLLFVIGIGLFIFTEGIAPLGEALPAIGFHIWIFTVSVIALNEKSHRL